VSELEAILSDITLKDRYTALVSNNLWTGATRQSDGLPVIQTQGMVVKAYKLSLLYNKGTWGNEVRTSGPVNSVDPQYLEWYTPVTVSPKITLTAQDQSGPIMLELMALADKYGITVDELKGV